MNTDSIVEHKINERFPLKTKTRHGQKQTFRRKMATKDAALAEETKKRQEAEELSETDELTGLPNLRAYRRRLEEEVEKNKRMKRTSTLLAVDLDGFKAINDRLGHDAGDETLKLAASVFKKSIRAVDFVARGGEKGDEFRFIFSETDEKQVWDIWETRLKPATQDAGIALSAGASEINPLDPVESEKFADNALYESKKMKNRKGNTLTVKGKPK